MSVLVFAESTEGAFKKSTFEAVSFAKEIAKQRGINVVAVSVGNVPQDQLTLLGKYGADQVFTYNKPEAAQFNAQVYAAAIAEAAKTSNAAVVIISNTYSGKSVAPRVAIKLNAGIVSGVVALPQSGDKLTVRKTVFSNKAFANVDVNGQVKVITLTPNSYQLVEHNLTPAIQELGASIAVPAQTTQVKNTIKASGKIPLTEAEIVVSGGRGMKGPENWGLIEELADILGAATACSKPVSDMHWRPHTEHVGQTGITIKPNLYIAVGISGAIQHLAGVSSSKVIVVINKDPEAPFFKAADYGIVGDAFDVLPKLIDAAKALKSATS